jgi:hypothetical protein
MPMPRGDAVDPGDVEACGLLEASEDLVLDGVAPGLGVPLPAAEVGVVQGGLDPGDVASVEESMGRHVVPP